ncbi:hypothetical protein INT45_010009 [Circinella minor]|uniref:Uncharacterized protein n=1 Tax=Circinella minor TaxID=1195481 RepID=A0A8H7S7N9_9FUNG|nr:hypothetical protein INT45_010009 [Circinella minor]
MSKSSNSIPNELQETWDDYNAARDACFKWARSDLSSKKRKMVLGCKHYGKPANNDVHEYEQKYSKPKKFVANDNGEVLRHMDSTGMKH